MWAIFLVIQSIVFMGPSIGSAVDFKVEDKNCWIEVFDDDEFDEGDPHVKIQGPAEYATLKDVYGRNWNNDIESVIVGSNATVHAWMNTDFKGPELTLTPGQRVPKLSKLEMSNTIESMKITCGP
ncbi:MAG TPA: beta/gamma crystallin domain-containing protein [Anaerolineales bacterium]|nr:beta/gamma crystallin domain-containing protein [Anaerolineales bacterium]